MCRVIGRTDPSRALRVRRPFLCRTAGVVAATALLNACGPVGASALPPSASLASGTPAVSAAVPATQHLRGTVLKVSDGTLTLKTAMGVQTLDLAASIRAESAAGSVPLQAGQGVSVTEGADHGQVVVRAVHLLTPAPVAMTTGGTVPLRRQAAATATSAGAAVAPSTDSVPRLSSSAAPSSATPVSSSAGVAMSRAGSAPVRKHKPSARGVTVTGTVRAVAAGSLQVAPVTGPVVSLSLGKHLRVRLARKGGKPVVGSLAQVQVGASVRIRARAIKKGWVARSVLVRA